MQFNVSQIAAFVNGTVEGDGNAAVSTFAKIEEAAPGSITFLANPKYTHHIYTTGATAVLVNRDFVAEHPVKATLIRVDNAYEALAALMRAVEAALRPVPNGIEEPCHIADGVDRPEGLYVGAFAYVGRGVKLGKDVKIYPQVYVGDNVTVGDGTVLYPGCRIYSGCRIGKRCVVHAGAVIGADGFGFAPDANGVYSKVPQLGIVEIGDDVEIGANTTVDRATMGATVVGAGTKLDNLVQVAHNVVIGSNTVVAAQAGFAGSSKIGDNCMIGGQVGVAGHISVGNRVQVGAQTGIPSSVEADSRIMGYPAVDARQFARQAAMMRRLGNLFDRVADLEKNKN